MHWFMYASSVVVAIIGLAGVTFVLAWIWLKLFDYLTIFFELHLLFKDFIWERYAKRPSSNKMSDKEVAELKRRTGR